MQQQPNVSELRATSDEAVAAAQAGLGPLFASHLQTQLLERPQDFVNDQVPLVSAAARARLALLDAEAAETDAATTPAALKRLLEREVSKVLGAQEQFEARVGEKLDELRTRVEKGEEAVHQLVTVKGAELRDELTRLAAQQHEKSATELVEKMGAFAGRFENAMLQMEAKLTQLSTKLEQLELVCPGGRVEVDPMALLGKLGFSSGSLPAARDELARKTVLDFSGKGLEADDGRALAGLLGSYGNTVDFKELDVSNSRIGNVGLTALADTIETGAFDGLHHLNLANARIGYKGMQALTKAMSGYGTLRLVDLILDGNKILAAGGMAVGTVLQTEPSLFMSMRKLSLNGGNIGDEAAELILQALQDCVSKVSELEVGLRDNLLRLRNVKANGVAKYRVGIWKSLDMRENPKLPGIHWFIDPAVHKCGDFRSNGFIMAGDPANHQHYSNFQCPADVSHVWNHVRVDNITDIVNEIVPIVEGYIEKANKDGKHKDASKGWSEFLGKVKTGNPGG